MKVWVVIPAYNEELNLVSVLNELCERELCVLVVDDGSKDATYKVAEERAEMVIRNDRNLGKGMSLKKGIAYLFKNKDFDYIMTMDSDGQHSPLDIDEFLKQADKGADFIIGNRMHNPMGMPKIRVITNKFMSWFISKIAGVNIPDTQCGFRLIKREVLEKVRIKTSKFEIESEIIIKAARQGFVIKSVPIQSIYSKNNFSRIRPVVDTLRFIRFILRLKDEPG
ncbi:MAG: glycosyltransferase family 2 protein [Candidatus Omnitrophota bacterium]